MEPTQKSSRWPHLFVIAAFAVAGWALVFKTGVAASDEAGIVLQLPAQVGRWGGLDMLFCPDRDCGRQYLAEQLENPNVCPECGAPLGNMNWAERSMLPADTGMARKYYVRPDGRHPIHATIVLSGDDRSSIHRPQVCMTAAGHEITASRLIRIPLAGRDEPLEVMVLDMAAPTSAPTENPPPIPLIMPIGSSAKTAKPPLTSPACSGWATTAWSTAFHTLGLHRHERRTHPRLRRPPASHR